MVIASDLLAYSWWRLPDNYSEHGKDMDVLYYAVFWLTFVVMVGVLAVMVYFLWKYRYSKDRKKARFSHGNTKLEMVWTIIPAIILIVLSLWTKQAWDKFRYNAGNEKEETTKILVIGQQFKWNTIYPYNPERAAKLAALSEAERTAKNIKPLSPDSAKKIGKYLIFPKPTDAAWPIQDPLDDSPIDFVGIYKAKGPAFLPRDEAIKAINSYLDSKNPLGKDFSDPDGLDDDFADALNRTVYVPKGKTVEISLSSKDVLHDFFLPNFRVKLDAVPGMRGLIYFKPTASSAEIEAASRKSYKLADVAAQFTPAGGPNLALFVEPGKEYFTLEPKKVTAAKLASMFKEETPDVKLAVRANPPPPDGVTLPDDVTIEGTKYVAKGETLATDGEAMNADKVKALRAAGFKSFWIYDRAVLPSQTQLTAETVRALQSAGFTEVTAYTPQVWDLVCEELCGAQHNTMKGTLIVLEQDAYRQKFGPPAPAPVAATPATPGVVASK